MEEQIVNDLPQELEVVDIQFRPGQKVYFFDPAGFKLAAGDHVIIDTSGARNLASAPAATTRCHGRTS